VVLIKRDKPKASAIIQQLTEGTGGQTFPFAEAQTAAKAICDEMRRNRYLLSYMPLNVSTFRCPARFSFGKRWHYRSDEERPTT
jgi:hypothetical protein